ncbi:hypothetical protein JJ691_65890 [Kutzneria sp. CA-103260]|nr:hypothetical protein JJ691_65890 [Kutzneria sp. CA-103260]
MAEHQDFDILGRSGSSKQAQQPNNLTVIK